MPEGYSIGELAAHIHADVVGDANVRITGLGALASAREGQLAFLGSPSFKRHLSGTRASAVVVSPRDAAECTTNCIVSENPRLDFARLSQLFDDRPADPRGVHPWAKIHPSVVVPVDVSVGPNAVIGARVILASGVSVGANCVVGDDCVLGQGTRLMPGVVLYHRVRIGARCIIHSGSVIGGDGFGFVPDAQGRFETVAQVGGVRVGDDVSIGSCTTIDRGAIEDTVIGNGVKIDNQVQIGHNCVIGDHSLLCGCVGLVGSTRIGQHCVLAGMVGVGSGAGPVEITDGVMVSGLTHVSRSIARPGVYSGGVLHSETRRWKRNALRFGELDTLAKRVADLEKRLAAPEDRRDNERRKSAGQRPGDAVAEESGG
jgi:UDP-3-O-[3-hydroxymyristoyl] glucosamine N-acyltransferase